MMYKIFLSSCLFDRSVNCSVFQVLVLLKKFVFQAILFHILVNFYGNSLFILYFLRSHYVLPTNFIERCQKSKLPHDISFMTVNQKMLLTRNHIQHLNAVKRSSYVVIFVWQQERVEQKPWVVHSSGCLFHKV